MKKSFKLVLTISILLNILFIGFFFGKVSNQMHPLPPRAEWKAERAEELPHEKRSEFKKFVNENNDRRREKFQQARKLRDELVSIMEAPEFDEQSFRSTSAQLDEIFSNAKNEMLEETIALAKKFNQQERKILAENLRKPPNQRGEMPKDANKHVEERERPKFRQ